MKTKKCLTLGPTRNAREALDWIDILTHELFWTFSDVLIEFRICYNEIFPRTCKAYMLWYVILHTVCVLWLLLGLLLESHFYSFLHEFFIKIWCNLLDKWILVLCWRKIKLFINGEKKLDRKRKKCNAIATQVTWAKSVSSYSANAFFFKLRLYGFCWAFLW